MERSLEEQKPDSRTLVFSATIPRNAIVCFSGLGLGSNLKLLILKDAWSDDNELNMMRVKAHIQITEAVFL